MRKRIGQTTHRRVRVRRRLLVERLGERRVLAAITGAVFEDANYSFQQDVGESNVPQRLVYIDANDNATLDNGESFVVAELDGTFEFPNLADGTYLLRLFNGTQTQTQTVPVEATLEGNSISVADAIQLELGDSASFALTTDSVVVGDLETGLSQSVSVGGQLSKMQTLPDGKLLIVGTDASGNTSWVFDPQTESVTPIDLSGAGLLTPWSDVAIDSDGRGVLLEDSLGLSAVRAIDASDAVEGVQATATSAMVPADTQVLTSNTGSRTVFGWKGADGLQLSLWSNVTESFITASPIDVSGTTGLLAFDDASGLLAVRTASGGISVHDVNADFAALHTLNNVTGPVAIDGARDLLMTISPVDAMLKIINLRDGALIADMAIDLSTVGQIASLVPSSSPDAVVVLGAAGVTEIALRKPAAHEVTIDGGQDSDPVLFGVALNGQNTAPTYTTLPTLVTNEDITLTLPAPGALSESADVEKDDFVLVQRGQAANGTAIFRVDGSLSYVPNPDFNGTDSVLVLLHDGRDVSAEVRLEITVISVPDSPSAVEVTINPLPENVLPGDIIGNVEIIDVDGGSYDIFIDDPRFAERNGQIIFIEGNIDFETEPFVPIIVTVRDSESSDVIEESIAVTITDENDPITAITPTSASVFENALGAVVTELIAHDQDVGQSHTFTVDDERFTVVGSELRLVDGVAVDFEIEETIVVNVTASEVPDGGTFTAAITIRVGDLPEQPLSIELTNNTVMEFVPGDVVGDVTLDSHTPSNRFILTVDDPRFEIDNGTLKLVDDQFVERASQSEIQLSVTAVDPQQEFTTITESFVIDVLENETPFHNRENPYDVDHSGAVTALDALVIINNLNSFGPGPVGQGDPGFCYDVNADGFVTALDALLVINETSRAVNDTVIVRGGEKEKAQGEGEQIPIQAPLKSPSAEKQDGDTVFDGWAQPGQKVGDANDVVPTGNTGHRIEIPTSSTLEEFADNVDETLRLLAEKNS